MAGLLWIGYDFTRVSRTRRDVRNLAKVDIDNARQAVDTAVTGRDLLKSLRGFSIPRPWKGEPEAEKEKGNSGFSVFGAFSSVLDVGADILDMALDEVPMPPGEEDGTDVGRRVRRRRASHVNSNFVRPFLGTDPSRVWDNC